MWVSLHLKVFFFFLAKYTYRVTVQVVEKSLHKNVLDKISFELKHYLMFIIKDTEPLIIKRQQLVNCAKTLGKSTNIKKKT